MADHYTNGPPTRRADARGWRTGVDTATPWAGLSPRPPLAEVKVERDVSARMRDGTVLRADVYRPAVDGRLPVILLRTPYDKRVAGARTFAHPAWFAERGFIVAVQDVRGRGVSEGEWYPFRSEAEDGAASVEWAADLRGSSGLVGMYGTSYAGYAQLAAATRRPRGLACIAPAMTSADVYGDWIYRGGVLQLAFVANWTLMLAEMTASRRQLHDAEGSLRAARGATAPHGMVEPLATWPIIHEHDLAPWFQDWLRHPTRDEFWDSLGLEHLLPEVDVPALHIGGWYDIFVEGTLHAHETLRRAAQSRVAREGQSLVVGPWHHVAWGSITNEVDYGPDAAPRIDTVLLRWFDRWLRREGDDAGPSRLFVTGYGTWVVAGSVVPEGPVTLFLSSNGSANSLAGDGRLDKRIPAADALDRFVYDPIHPTPSRGGRSCCDDANSPMGPADQRSIERSRGVLVYQSEPLDDHLLAVGSPTTTLVVESDGVDTDWTAKLVDITPDGRRYNVADGLLCARYRGSDREPSPAPTGIPYEVTIQLGPIAHRFGAGHRVGLEVSSSNYPAYARNLNTGADASTGRLEDRHIATQTVHHGPTRRSRVVLPVAKFLTRPPDPRA